MSTATKLEQVAQLAAEPFDPAKWCRMAAEGGMTVTIYNDWVGIGVNNADMERHSLLMRWLDAVPDGLQAVGEFVVACGGRYPVVDPSIRQAAKPAR